MKQIAVLIVAASGFVVAGSLAAPRDTMGRPNVALPADSAASPLSYFSGHWSCAGGTPAGRVLTADVDFTPAMNGRWLEVRHLDHPPGRYESLSLWGPLPGHADSVMTTIVYDNFGGSRRFFSSGWREGKVVWTRDTTEAGSRLETFTYQRVSDSAYWYAWHVRRADGTPVVLGDSATCQRR
jgi:hypothetical protein